ncbi:hypothetical protein [Roseovarius atlanticus]|uniref:hypothetical protein n=1 Tax=Roseovarius atlanticus TaxID=1641875 RepID=UPI001C96F2FC|nr:hypothetical protein [Roseovarius atlanticus]MBY5987633.1 hypothetical protein [Roseovarius atlanticus]MBY6123024.1 hypothetical protein [Roseovarius atlanticus]MBY6147520.1 hypothetical protein [Roseovarius atlanticus]
MRVEIHIGQASITAEGELAEVQVILTDYWKPVLENPVIAPERFQLDEEKQDHSTKKTTRKRTSSKTKTSGESDNNTSQLNGLEIANAIKERTDFGQIKAKILDVQGQWKEKCMLVAVVADSPINSGDVKRVMDALRIKSSLPTLSKTLSNNSTEFLTRNGPKNSTLYTVTGAAKDAFMTRLNETDE